MFPKDISISDYQYDLPADRIAAYPLEERDASKLLVYQNGNIQSDVYRNLAEHLPAESLLLMNDTRVIEARFVFQKDTGGLIEIFCLEPAANQLIEEGLISTAKVTWNCLVGGVAKWKQPLLTKTIVIVATSLSITARLVARHGEYCTIEFEWTPPAFTFGEIMPYAGVIPLPPYMQREANEADVTRYQTVYAKKEGSVAAPTAGLHFTDALLARLGAKGIQTLQLTLLVGAVSFLPEKSETISGHEMHREWIRVSVSLMDQLIAQGNQPIVALGTTSLRTLETLYWMGVKLIRQPDLELEALEIQQWDPYEISAENIAPVQALQALKNWLHQRGADELVCKTQLLIAPGYTIRLAGALLTNFHQPGSTLLLLVAAFIGENWRAVYRYALDNEYRFLSYGDGSLLWRGK